MEVKFTQTEKRSDKLEKTFVAHCVGHCVLTFSQVAMHFATRKVITMPVARRQNPDKDYVKMSVGNDDRMLRNRNSKIILHRSQLLKGLQDIGNDSGALEFVPSKMEPVMSDFLESPSRTLFIDKPVKPLGLTSHDHFQHTLQHLPTKAFQEKG